MMSRGQRRISKLDTSDLLDYTNFLVSSSIPSCVGKLSPWVSGRSVYVCVSVLCMHVYGAGSVLHLRQSKVYE